MYKPRETTEVIFVLLNKNCEINKRMILCEEE